MQSIHWGEKNSFSFPFWNWMRRNLQRVGQISQRSSKGVNHETLQAYDVYKGKKRGENPSFIQMSACHFIWKNQTYQKLVKKHPYSNCYSFQDMQTRILHIEAILLYIMSTDILLFQSIINPQEPGYNRLVVHIYKFFPYERILLILAKLFNIIEAKGPVCWEFNNMLGAQRKKKRTTHYYKIQTSWQSKKYSYSRENNIVQKKHLYCNMIVQNQT